MRPQQWRAGHRYEGDIVQCSIFSLALLQKAGAMHHSWTCVTTSMRYVEHWAISCAFPLSKSVPRLAVTD